MANNAEAAEPSEPDSDVPSEPEMIDCELFPGGRVEKEIAYHRRNIECGDCDRCV